MTRYNFLFLSTTDWDAPQFGSRQQIAQILGRRGHQVLFVDVPRALHSFISAPGETRRALGRFGQIRPVQQGIWGYTPPPVLPIYYNPITNGANQRLLTRYLRGALKRLKWDRLDFFWTYWPNSAYLVGRLGERASIYHCIDALDAVRYPLTPPNAIADMDEQLWQVDLIFARTQALTAAKQRFNPHTIFLPGGVDVKLFDPTTIAAPMPEVASLPHPRVGFLGTLDDRLDAPLLARCVEQLPHVNFVFVGPIKRHLVDLRPIQAQPNAHFFPACSHQDAPHYVSAFDVCLIPYHISPYTEGLSPLKLYEYLALGKSVVATDLPYLRREQTHITIAKTTDAYVAAIQHAIDNPPSQQEESQWRAVAESYSWESQVDLIETHLQHLLEQQLSNN